MKPLKIGIIGIGGMGRSHARSAVKLEEVEVVAVADMDVEAARKIGAEIGATAFPDHHSLLKSGEVEAVLIATPHYFHPPIAIAAARRGIHVLCEKPIAVSVGAADKMVAACHEAGVLLGVVFQQRTEASRLKMKQMVEEGVIGELYRVSMTAPWYRPQFYYDSGSWRGTWQGEGGGILMNQSPHSLDQFNWLAGMPQSIQAVATTRLHDIEVENTALAICDYGDGKLGWFYTSTAEIPGEERLEVAGDRGILSWQNGKLRHFELEQPLSEHLRSCPEMFGSVSGQWRDVAVEEGEPSHMKVVQAFARAVRQKNPALMVASGEDGLRSLELANAMLMAGYTRREVSLPLNRAKFERMLNRLKNGVKPGELRR